MLKEAMRINREYNISLYTKWLGIYFLLLIVTGMGIGMMGSLLRLFAAIPIIFWLINDHRVRVTGTVLSSICFLIVCAATVYWSIDMEKSISRTMTQAMFLVLLMSASYYCYNAREIEYLKSCLIWSSRISAIVLLCTGTYSAGRLLLSGMITEDPNYLCGYFLFAISNAVAQIMNSGTTMRNKCLFTVEILLYTYIVFSTGSRGGMFAVAATIVAQILIFQDSNTNRGVIVKKVLVAIMILLFAYFATSLLPSEVASRFTTQAIKESNGTGRYDLWKDALNAWNNSTLFRQILGYGTAAIRKVTYLFPFHRHNVLHNVFIENLVEIGAIGLAAYVIQILSFWGVALKTKNLFSVAILAGMLVLSLSTSIYAFKPYWNIMLYVVCVGCMAKSEEALDSSHIY